MKIPGKNFYRTFSEGCEIEFTDENFTTLIEDYLLLEDSEPTLAINASNLTVIEMNWKVLMS